MVYGLGRRPGAGAHRGPGSSEVTLPVCPKFGSEVITDFDQNTVREIFCKTCLILHFRSWRRSWIRVSTSFQFGALTGSSSSQQYSSVDSTILQTGYNEWLDIECFIEWAVNIERLQNKCFRTQMRSIAAALVLRCQPNIRLSFIFIHSLRSLYYLTQLTSDQLGPSDPLLVTQKWLEHSNCVKLCQYLSPDSLLLPVSGDQWGHSHAVLGPVCLQRLQQRQAGPAGAPAHRCPGRSGDGPLTEILRTSHKHIEGWTKYGAFKVCRAILCKNTFQFPFKLCLKVCYTTSPTTRSWELLSLQSG